MILANRIFRRLGLTPRFRRGLDPIHDMSVVEHRLNLFHLADQVCAYDVAGDFVELGTFVGETALVIAHVLESHGSPRRFHVFDSFEYEFESEVSPRAELERNFATAALRLPEIHAGRFEQTVPAELPERIAFVHVDCGTGGGSAAHGALIRTLLEHIYPRMSPGGIIVFMDYSAYVAQGAYDSNPGVRPAVDAFFEPQGIAPHGLYAGEGAMGYVRIPLNQ